MAINPNDRYPGQTTAPSADYPYGGARNQSVLGDNTGTPLEADLVNDIWGFHQSLLSEAGISPSGDPETAQDSQYLEALSEIFQRRDTGFQLTNVRVLTTADNGASPYVPPAGVRALRIIAIGGGGAGGGNASTTASTASVGAGGGPGGVGVKWLTSLSASYAYNVGAGGAGALGAAGGAGSATTIAGVSAGGGFGGTVATGEPPLLLNGAGYGPVTGADYIVSGQRGGSGISLAVAGSVSFGGLGGASGFGHTDLSNNTDGYGFGGSGRHSTGGAITAQAGYDGGDGAIIIEEYV